METGPGVIAALRAEGGGWKTPLALFVGTLVVYAAFAYDRLGGPSEDNHFAYLAESFLAGSLEMQRPAPHGNDWATLEILRWEDGAELRGIWQDRRERVFRDLQGELHALDPARLRSADASRVQYVSFPPMPAVLMLPAVAFKGIEASDVHLTLVLAALNVVLLYWLLTLLRLRGYTARSQRDNLWLTLFFAFGSVHLWCSVLGQVWFTALVVGITFTLLYVMAALDARHPFWAGVFLACAFATRTPLLFSVLFFAWMFFLPGGRLRADWGARFWRDGLLFAAAPLAVGLALMAMNHARFASYTEFGHIYLAAGQIPRIKEYGLFHPIFINRNLASMFALVPHWVGEAPWILVSRHGLAIWFTMPALLLLFRSLPSTSRAESSLRWAVGATTLVIALPHVLYQNTGWEQFGYRFAMDYLVYLVLLLALGRRPIDRWFQAAVVFGVVVNAFGAVTFKRMPRFYTNSWFPYG